jgi:siroheme synthase (precorrin-2 oxidase/ferrochelatase)
MRYEELAAKFGGAVEDVVANKEIDEIGRSVKTLVNQLDKGKRDCSYAYIKYANIAIALSTKTIPNATKYANDLKEKIAPLIAKHASQGL